jgi:hypothetical protein
LRGSETKKNTTAMVVTFLPYADITKSLETLDKRRLGKQRVEAKQIIQALEGKTKGWVNHPAAKMWAGYLPLLKQYYNTSLQIWEKRGGKNKLLEPMDIGGDILYPEWWGWDHFHASHRAALYRKDPEYYAALFDCVYVEFGYIWPHKHTRETPFPELFEPINPNQLRPKCSHPGCKNPMKKELWCGVHARKYIKV